MDKLKEFVERVGDITFGDMTPEQLREFAVLLVQYDNGTGNVFAFLEGMAAGLSATTQQNSAPPK